ncbi:MAG: phosphate ABC transporter permease PstA [Phycisphaerae bacterium]
MTNESRPRFEPRLAQRRRRGGIFVALCVALSACAVLFVAVLLWQVASMGWGRISPKFFANFFSQNEPATSGIKAPLIGTLWLIVIAAAVAVPVGVGAAVYLEEYAAHNWLTRIIHLNIANLAGVPSIVYGILGLSLFVHWMSLNRSVMAGGLTLALLILPVIIIASREALAAVPKSIRDAAYALGATRWQTVRYHVLPAALPGILTGVILSLSRAIGEAAPLMVVGVVFFTRSVPVDPLRDEFTAMPIQIYNWTDNHQPIFHELAAAGILVLLAFLILMNALAIGIRACSQESRA